MDAASVLLSKDKKILGNVAETIADLQEKNRDKTLSLEQLSKRQVILVS